MAGKRKKPTVVYKKELFGKGIEVSVDRHSWIVKYADGDPQYYSNFTEMIGSLYKNSHNSLIKDLDLQKIRATVLGVQSELIAFSLDIKELFETTPFMTPERRHQDSKEGVIW